MSGCRLDEEVGTASSMFMTSDISFPKSSAIVYYSIFFFQFDCERVAQRKKEMGELALFQTCNQLLEVFLGELAGAFFKDGLRGLGRWRVEKQDRSHVLAERLRDARKLLGQHPHADAGVARRKAQLDELPRPPFLVFRGNAVVKNNEGVGAFKENTRHLQPRLDLVLLADDDIQPRISLGKPKKGFVGSQRRTDERDVVEPAAERAHSWSTRNHVFPELVGPTMSALKGAFAGSIHQYCTEYSC